LKVTIQYFDGCPHWELADKRLKRVLAAEPRDDVEIEYELIDSADEAECIGFHGSPTILFDGRDPFVNGDEPPGLACRVFRTERGREGSPSEAQLRAALSPKQRSRHARPASTSF
jgi:hypothetical protein